MTLPAQYIDVCGEARRNANALLLKRACEQEEEMHPVDWMYLLGALRNEASFRELSQYIDVPSDSNGVLKFIYPGSGDHIAALTIATELMNAHRISEAHFTFTDVNPCKRDRLPRILEELNKFDSSFQVDDSGYSEQSEGEGTIQNYLVRYKGQPIYIKFLFKMSGEAWYLDEDMDNSDKMIIHDPGGSIASLVVDPLFSYFESHLKSKKGPSQIIMEDLTRMRGSRDFDLELIGTFDRGTEGTFYGHREHSSRIFSGFSAERACVLQEAGKASKEQVVRWEKNNSMGIDSKVYEEVGHPFAHNGVVLQPHPDLFRLEAQVLHTLMEISLAANDYGTDTKGIGEEISEEGERLLSPDFYGEVFEHAELLIKKMEKVNPNLARVLVIRIFQVLMKDEGQLAQYMVQNKIDNTEYLDHFLTFLEDHLNSEIKEEASEALKWTKNHVLNLEGNQVSNSEREDYWSQFNKIAERLMEEAENTTVLSPNAMNYLEDRVVLD